MKQRAAKHVAEKLSSKKRKNGKIIIEAQSYIKAEKRGSEIGLSSTALIMALLINSCL